MIRRGLIALAAVAACAPATTASADTATASARSCSQPLVLTDQCLENTICGLPGRVTDAAGLDAYGLDPTVNCVT